MARQALLKLGCQRSSHGWWSYEICFEKNITQYHSFLDNSLKRIVIDVESSLGEFSKSGTETRLNALYGNAAEQSSRPRDSRGTTMTTVNDHYSFNGFVPKSLFLPGMKKSIRGYAMQYSNGTPCEETGKLRETLAVYACSPNLQTHVKVLEESTCEYIVVVYVKEMCLFKQFQRLERGYYF